MFKNNYEFGIVALLKYLLVYIFYTFTIYGINNTAKRRQMFPKSSYLINVDKTANKIIFDIPDTTPRTKNDDKYYSMFFRLI
jgi:hypothetical protein